MYLNAINFSDLIFLIFFMTLGVLVNIGPVCWFLMCCLVIMWLKAGSDRMVVGGG